MDGAIVAKFFYSHRDGELERNHKRMLQCLLYDILKKDESFFMHFQQAYRDLGASSDWAYAALKAVLKSCLNHPLKQNLFLIIDALDESDENDRADIVEFLRELSNPAGKRCIIKVFLASRPINEIYPISISGDQRIRLQDNNREDIEIYTHWILQKPLFNSYSDIRGKIQDYIVKNADGVFLWVRVVGDELEKCCRKGSPSKKMLIFLESLPKELEGYYKYILQGLNGSDEDDKRDGIRILQFCLFSHRPIELLELCDALAIPGEILPAWSDLPSWEDDRPKDIILRLTNSAGGFVETKSISGLHISSKSPVPLGEPELIIPSSLRGTSDCPSHASDSTRIFSPPS